MHFYTGLLVAIVIGFGGLAVDAGTLIPNQTLAQSAPNSGTLAGTLEEGQESTDLEVEPMAAEDAERNKSSDISSTTVTSNNPQAEATNASEAPILLRRWIYPWP